jgi:hypothetical protein
MLGQLGSRKPLLLVQSGYFKTQSRPWGTDRTLMGDGSGLTIVAGMLENGPREGDAR